MNSLRFFGMLTGVVMLYILSIGPAVMLWPEGGKTVEGFYYPVIQTCKNNPVVVPAILWYLGIWERMGRR